MRTRIVHVILCQCVCCCCLSSSSGAKATCRRRSVQGVHVQVVCQLEDVAASSFSSPGICTGLACTAFGSAPPVRQCTLGALTRRLAGSCALLLHRRTEPRGLAKQSCGDSRTDEQLHWHCVCSLLALSVLQLVFPCTAVSAVANSPAALVLRCCACCRRELLECVPRQPHLVRRTLGVPCADLGRTVVGTQVGAGGGHAFPCHQVTL